MKKILILTYYWPPSGGAAVQRWLSFANKLAEKNYEVHLLTVHEKFATYQLRDETLVAQIHPSINVHTTKTTEPFKVFTLFFGKKSIPKPAFSNETNASFTKKVSRFIRGNFYIPDPRKGWKKYALKKASELIKEHHIAHIITAGPPHSTHFIGKALKEQLGIKWITDFHDLWTDVIYYDMLYHLPIVKRKDKQLEKIILEASDCIVTVGEKYKQKLLTKSDNVRKDKIKILRIGYDEKIFGQRLPPARQEKFIITYTGTIANFYQPEVFVAALKNVVTHFPEIPFLVRFAGILSAEIKTEFSKAGLNSILEDLGYLSHRQSIALLKQATILLLVNPVTKDEAMVIPGKLYEYLAAGKPVINITKSDAETAMIITACRAGQTFNRSQQTELENYLSSLVNQWQEKHSLDIYNNEQLTSHYSRESITNDLIKIIEAI